MMPKNMIDYLRKLRHSIGYLLTNQRSDLEQLQINQAKIFQQKLFETCESSNIQDYEFKVFSQWGDDGIIQFLINTLSIDNHTFIEFGVEDFTESNCRFLMINDNWSGFVIDGSVKHVQRIKRQSLYWKYDLIARCEFVTKENIGDLLYSSGFGNEPGLISIDIDGMDYWVFQEIELQPAIFIIEYNAIFGKDRLITVPYDPKFTRTTAHYSNLFYGASLSALTRVAVEKGYSLVGCNSAGNNAYFVRNDLMPNIKLESMTATEAFVDSKFRESRDLNGNLTHMRGAERLNYIEGMPVFNTLSGKIERL